ncbi:MAG: hypothetical protein ACHBN1_34390 [Heteroscytonema crispum UTEX LB 1556]
MFPTDWSDLKVHDNYFAVKPCEKRQGDRETAVGCGRQGRQGEFFPLSPFPPNPTEWGQVAPHLPLSPSPLGAEC